MLPSNNNHTPGSVRSNKSVPLVEYFKKIATRLRSFGTNRPSDMLSSLAKELGSDGEETRKGYKLLQFDSSVRIVSDEEAVGVFRSLWDSTTFALQERLYAVYMNADDCAIGAGLISIGSTTVRNVQPSRILQFARELSAVKVILAHNHPSGVNKPSSSDIEFTSIVSKVLEKAEIELEAHYILTQTQYESISLIKS